MYYQQLYGATLVEKKFSSNVAVIEINWEQLFPAIFFMYVN